MIKYNKDNQAGEIFCDKCNYSGEFEGFDWFDFLNNAKSDGWKVKLENDEFHHYCEDCIK